MKIAIVGTGNVAYHLSKALDSSGCHRVVAVSSRSVKKATVLCEQLYRAVPMNHTDFREFEPDIIFLAIKDDFIAEYSSKILAHNDCLLVHLSGNYSYEIMQTQLVRAVFYPLYSFTKDYEVVWNHVSFFIESETPNAYTKLFNIANTLKSSCYPVSSHQKKALHVAAVFAQNFTNHLLKIAYDICEVESLPFKALQPLVEHGIRKAFDINPEASQTGPAIRNDQYTVISHLNFLQDNPELYAIYQMLSNHITQTYSS